MKREVEYGSPEQNETVQQIVERFAREGDAALLRYTEQLDRDKLTPRAAARTEEEIQAAYAAGGAAFLTAIRQAAANIRRFTRSRSAIVDGFAAGRHDAGQVSGR